MLNKTLPAIYINSRSRVILDDPFSSFPVIKLQYKVKFYGFSLWKTVNEQFQCVICYPNSLPSADDMVKAAGIDGQKNKLFKLSCRRVVAQAALRSKRVTQ